MLIKTVNAVNTVMWQNENAMTNKRMGCYIYIIKTWGSHGLMDRESDL